jgi:cellulose synthase/poly-beta-1,6-N-acetylglucosamine synthase-like glycosyltransferase
MHRPTISIVIPTAGLHRRGVLGECLASLARSIDAAAACDESPSRAGAPAPAAAEIVLVLDGGHPEHYEEVLAGHEVRVLTQAPSGPAAARNRGWRASTGEVVAFVDDDVVVGTGWFARLGAFFAAHPEAAGAGGPVLPLAEKNLVSRTLTDHGHLAHRRHPDGGWLLLTANAAFRRGALEAVDGFDERFRLASGEDLDLCERLRAAGHRVELVDDAVVVHHHPTTLRALRALARRYAAPCAPPDDPVAAGAVVRGRRPAGPRRSGSIVAGTVRNLRNVPAWYAVGRRAPHHPAPHVAIGEALLHVLWQAEYDRAVVAAEGARPAPEPLVSAGP